MDILLVLVGAFGLLLWSASRSIFLGYPLLGMLVVLILVLWRRGFAPGVLLKTAIASSQKALPVLQILLLIGAVTAAWMAAGTVPAIVYYGTQWISPQWFVLAAFGLTSAVSLLIGTSFGTVGTIGVALMILARGSAVNPHLIAGAIIAGAYLGDRCSPMSSSANLIAAITQTDLYDNIRQMWRTALAPLLLSVMIYGLFSLFHPVVLNDSSFTDDIPTLFHLHPIVLLPAGVILVLSLAQVNVQWSMLASIGAAGAIALSLQQVSPWQLGQFILVGFQLENASPLAKIFVGGGVVPMLKVLVIVVLSIAFVGIFDRAGLLSGLENRVGQMQTEGDRFLKTCLLGTGTAAFGCTQTIAILLTQQLVEKKYKENEKGNSKLALDLENTVVVISPLIPWNIAGLVPATVLMTDAGFIPYAVYLYLIPLMNLFWGLMALRPQRHPNYF